MGFNAGSLTSPAVLAKAMRSRLGDQTRKMISCGSCFSPTTRKDGKQVGKRNMGATLQRHPSRRPAGAPSQPPRPGPGAASPSPPALPELRPLPYLRPTRAGPPRPPSAGCAAAPPRCPAPPPRCPAPRALRALPAPGLPREKKARDWKRRACGLRPRA